MSVCPEPGLQGYLADKKQPPFIGPPYGPRHSPAVGSQEGGVSYERGTPVSQTCAEAGLTHFHPRDRARPSRKGMHGARIVFDPKYVQRFRGGLVFKARRRLYHSTLCVRVTKKKRRRSVINAHSGHRWNIANTNPFESYYTIRGRANFFFFITLKHRVQWYTKSMSLKYEPASEPLHISVKQSTHSVDYASSKTPRIWGPRDRLYT